MLAGRKRMCNLVNITSIRSPSGGCLDANHEEAGWGGREGSVALWSIASMLRPQGDMLRLVGAVMEPQHGQRGAQVIDGLHQHGQRHFHISNQIGELAGSRC